MVKIGEAVAVPVFHNGIFLIFIKQPMEMIEEALACGKREFGENKAQEMKEKCDALPFNADMGQKCDFFHQCKRFIYLYAKL